MGKEKIFNILTIVNKVLQLVFEALAKAKNKSLAFLTGRRQDPPNGFA